ncbi:MAG: helix-turn-helix domain-containing protein [Verrucomicrobia bacterium]|nr:helix-turn-helix domain-containing protein [Verrucomicrobiota bacterium]
MPDATNKLLLAKTVGDRLGWLREFKGLTLQQFAERVGCDAGYLSKLETGKAKQPSDRFLKVVRDTFAVRSDWLWEGDGDPFFENEAGVKAKPAEKWLEDRAQRVHGVISDLPDELAVHDVLARILRDMPRTLIFERWMEISNLPDLPLSAQWFWQKGFLHEIEKRLKAEAEAGRITAIDIVHDSVNTGEVKAQWPLLKKKLQLATKPDGAKTKLADFLGVKIASVSQWLSESKSKREPSAEYALQMQEWLRRPQT